MIYRRDDGEGLFAGKYNSVQQGQGDNIVDPETNPGSNVAPMPPQTDLPSGLPDQDWQPLPFDRWMSEQVEAAPLGPQNTDYWWELYLDYISSGGKQFYTGG